MVYQMLVAINKDIPEPNPNPCFIISSSKITINPAVTICRIIITDKNAPISETSPYIPDNTKPTDSIIVMIIPNSFYAPLKSFLSSEFE